MIKKILRIHDKVLLLEGEMIIVKPDVDMDEYCRKTSKLLKLSALNRQAVLKRHYSKMYSTRE